MIEKAWNEALASLDVPRTVETDATVARILAAYHTKGRFYHTIEHLEELLAFEDDGMLNFERPYYVLATVYHDYVYEAVPDAQNEARSAAAYIVDAERIGISRGVHGAVIDAILHTDHKEYPTSTRVAQSLVEADLAILASPWERYDRYRRDVRKEWAHVSDRDFRAGRRSFLEGMLAKPVLFRQFPLLDGPARENMTRELELLREDAATEKLALMLTRDLNERLGPEKPEDWQDAER